MTIRQTAIDGAAEEITKEIDGELHLVLRQWKYCVSYRWLIPMCVDTI